MKLKNTSRKRSADRSGVATLWIILTVLLGAIMFCIVIEVGNLWVARVQLQTGLESASLAAVREWGLNGANGGATLSPRNRGVALAAANSVGGNSVTLANNHNGGSTNGNQNANGHLVFGGLSSTSPNVFNPNASAGCNLGDPPPVVRARATVSVPALCSGIFGVGSYNVTATSYAVFNCTNSRPELLFID